MAGIFILVVCAAFVLETRWHRNLFYLIGVPTFLLGLLGANLRTVWTVPLSRMIVAYVVYFCATAVWSDAFSWLEFGDLLRVGLLSLLFITMATSLTAGCRAFEEKLFFWVCVTAGISLTLLLAATLLGLIEPGSRLTGFGITSHPIVGATLYGVVLLVCTFTLIPAAKTGREQLCWLGIIALCAVFMLMAGSRGPLLALAAALAISLVFSKARYRIIVFGVAGFFFASLAVGLAIGVESIETTLSRGLSGHVQLWAESLSAIAERPWFGHGALTEMTFESRHGALRSPHNLYIANHLYGGLPASALLAGLLYLGGKEAVKAARAGAPIYLALMTFGLTCAFFDTRSLVQNLGREWITIWLPLAFLAARQFRFRPPRPEKGLSIECQ